MRFRKRLSDSTALKGNHFRDIFECAERAFPLYSAALGENIPQYADATTECAEIAGAVEPRCSKLGTLVTMSPALAAQVR